MIPNERIFMTLSNTVYQLIRESIEPGSTELGSVAAGQNIDDATTNIDWNEVYAEMKAQAVDALPQKWLLGHTLPDEELRRKWIRATYTAQTRWIKIMHGQDQLLKLLEKEKIDCVIIKGAAAAMAYPQPTLRKCGDIDFLVKQEDYERAAEVLEENGFEVEGGKSPLEHHYGYSKNGVHYELHRRLGGVREKNRELIELFEEGIANREYGKIEDHLFPVLPVELNGLVLLIHINQHLRSGLGLRHILDWMMYLRKNDNLTELLPDLRKIGLDKLALTVTAGCQECLGLREMVEDAQQYPYEEFMDYVWNSGNFGHKGGEEGKISYVFSIVTNPVRLIRQLQDGGLVRWKAASKYTFLRPFAWIYQIGFILHELIENQITPKKMLEQRKHGIGKRELYRKFGLDIDKEI